MKKMFKKALLVGKVLATLATPLIAANCSTNNTDALKFVAGGLTGLAIHEGAHYATAKMYGMDPGYSIAAPFEVSLNNYGDQSSNEKAIVAGSGLVAQTIATELILGLDSIPKDDPYVLGALTFAILDNIRYGLVPGVRGGENDVAHLDENGVNGKAVQVALLAHSASSIYRLLKNEDFKGRFNRRFNLSVVPGKNGMELLARYDF